MSLWHEIDTHAVQVLETGALLWEHNTRGQYRSKLGNLVTRHMVGTKTGATWQIVQLDPLTLTPSLHCDPEIGGCGRHGYVTDGHWVPAE